MRLSKRIVLIASTMAVVVTPVSPAYARTAGSSGVTETRTNAVIVWNANAAEAALAACIAPSDDPLHESRLYAMTHIAIHDALNAIDRRSRPYALRTEAKRGTSADAAVAAAAHDVMVRLLGQLPAPFTQACIDAGIASVEAHYKVALNGIPNGSAKTRGIDLGRAAAAAILQMRSADGSDTLLVDTGYPQGVDPGEYRFTPGTPFAFAPGWGEVAPFALRDNSQFGPRGPYAVTSSRYTADFQEVKRLGGDGVTTPSARTTEQTEVALFWVESSPHSWNRIARSVAVARGLDSWQSARLFGLLNMALADGYIATFATKYHFNFWRPVTAIQLAATDGNPNTNADPTWTPLRPTPPIPDYDSGHSVEGGAAAAVLRGFFGTDRVHFRACSFTLPAGATCNDASPVYRRFSSFSQAAAENAQSRILVGFHFRKAVEVGTAHGDKVGDYTVDRVLRPVR